MKLLNQSPNDAKITENVNTLRIALELYNLDNGKYPDSRNGVAWEAICDQTNIDLQNDLNPYTSGLFDSTNCDAIWYFTKPITSYYQTACQVPQFSNEQGYIVAYATSPETKQERWFFWEDVGIANWHCRGYDN